MKSSFDRYMLKYRLYFVIILAAEAMFFVLIFTSESFRTHSETYLPFFFMGVLVNANILLFFVILFIFKALKAARKDIIEDAKIVNSKTGQ